MSEKNICAICKQDIRCLGCHPIYSKVYNDTICSDCCYIGACYHLGIISEEQLKPIPEKFRKKIMRIYNEVN